MEVLEDRCVPAISLLNNFPSINYHTNSPSLITPPDTAMAAGPSEVISAGNTAVLIQSKTDGHVIAGATQFSQFLASIRQDPNGSYSNPQIVWDDVSQRFFLMVMELPSASAIDYLDLAVSKTANPTDLTSNSWTILPAITQVNQGSIDFAADPRMAVNQDAIFISFNTFGNNNQVYIQNDVWVISKAAVLSGTPLQLGLNLFDYSGNNNTYNELVRQTVYNKNTGIGNGPNRQVVPAMMHGNQPGNLEYFVADYTDQTWNNSSIIEVLTMQDYLSTDPKKPMVLSFYLVPVNNLFWVPEQVQQLVPPFNGGNTNSGNRELGVLDNIQNVDWSNNFLVASQNIGPSSNPGPGQSFCEAKAYELSTTAGANFLSILNEWTAAPGPGVDTSFPAVAVDPGGDMGITYIQTTSTADPSMWVTGRQFSDTPNKMQSPIQIAAGAAGLSIGTAGGNTAACQYDSSDYTFWAADEYTLDTAGSPTGFGTTDNWGIALANFASDPDVTYVNNVYKLLLGRSADPAGLKAWTDQLKNGLLPQYFVLDIEESREYLSDVVTALYHEYLYRPPDPLGLNTWVNALAGGTTIVQAEASFAASPEYFKDHSDNTLNFVYGLYTDILGRSGTFNEAAKWVYAINSGVSRYQVALDFLLSTENLSNFVRATYNHYLKRLPSPSETTYWVKLLQGGITNQEFVAAVLGSPEGFKIWS